MLKPRLVYLGLIIITIIAGLLSRQVREIPIFIGDVLWGLMIFFVMKFLFINKSLLFTVIISLCYSYATEFSQLYKAPWINHLRHTFLGKVLLGETFLWTDMLCYTAGICLGILTELSLRKLSTSLYAGDED